MESKDAYEIALKIADLYFKSLQFFIAICSLFGGWIVVQGLPGEWYIRAGLALIFSASTGALWIGQLSLLNRANAAISLSGQLLKLPEPSDERAIKPLFVANHSPGTMVGMGVVIVCVDVLIFFVKVQAN